ncbi:MAG: sugar phosphate isomerase/epimerase [Candidatus Hydrogenedentes bacterium]|nr:sugar phosphate isomerase/epimerase [Candidatus Hydrogenedentota bacterium]
MNISIRDSILLSLFPSVLDGLKVLELRNFELYINNNFEVRLLSSGDIVSLAEESNIQMYRQNLVRNSCEICGLLTEYDLSVNPVDKSIEWFTRVVRIAQLLNAKVVRVDSQLQQEALFPFGKKLDLFTEVFSEVLANTEDSGVNLGIENHGREGNNPIFLMSLVKNIHNPRFGITLDFGNFYWRGYPLSETMAILKLFAPYTVHTHIKNIAYPANVQEVYREPGWEYDTYVSPIYNGDVDIERVMVELKQNNYQNSFCIEDESLTKFDEKERIEVLKADISFIQEIINDIKFEN